MNVATALNRKYINYTIVMLSSLCENNSVHIDAYILHSELTEDDIRYMEQCLKQYDITLVPLLVEKSRFDDRLPRDAQWSIETYYRLMLMDLLPETVKRILYLDVDLIINKSLEEYYSVAFETDEIIACVDRCGKAGWQRSAKQLQMFAPMIECGYQYFNAGVMLLNVQEIRQKYHFEQYLAAIEEWNYEMSAPDQDILNYVHWQKIGYIDPYEYDLFARIAHNEKLSYDTVKQKAYIIHFAGDKPWETTNVHYDIEKIWWDYAKLTPCYGQLLSEFMDDIFFNSELEDKIQKILDDRKQLENKVDQLKEVTQRLLHQLESNL